MSIQKCIENQWNSEKKTKKKKLAEIKIEKKKTMYFII